MLLSIVLDLNRKEWKMSTEDPLNNLRVFINAFLIANPQNVVRVVNSAAIIFDSRTGEDFFTVFEKDGARPTPKDLGFALMELPDSILVFEMSPADSSDYIEYLKCMFVAQQRRIKIHAFSRTRNMLVRMCCEGSGGVFLDDYSLSQLFQLLGNAPNKASGYSIKCICCDKLVSVGLVCPVCLSVFCKFVPVCKKCKTKFSFIK